MTAFATDIATVQRLLPVRIDGKDHGVNIWILDRDGNLFCRVPTGSDTSHSIAVMIVSAINALSDQLVQRNHHGL